MLAQEDAEWRQSHPNAPPGYREAPWNVEHVFSCLGRGVSVYKAEPQRR